MPDMHAIFNSASPPKLDLSNAPSQLFQVPASTASTSLYSLSVSRKRPRRNTEKLSSHFDSFTGSSMIHSNYRSVSVSGGNDFHASAELDYRPNRYRESFLPPCFDSGDESTNLANYNGSRKRSRRDSCIISASPDGSKTNTTTTTGWGQTVIKAVSKVLDLCWAGAFRGFYAGGGQGYDISGPATTLESSWQPSTSPSTEKDMYSPSTYCSTPVPGQYPDEEVDRSWVVVPESLDSFVGGSELSSPSLRARRTFQASSPRRKSAVMPRLAKRVAYSSTGPHSPTKGQAGLPSPRLRDTPASADIQRQAAKMRRKEREEDASIQRLNKQLQAMIREGKEALGTTVVVDDVDMYDSD
ncbi:uncharacterized protein N7500_001608 [Penicillium coprophilum]|uniref:uncharacterized protein n=1 Tax=Penicillium coprophilum TaxID=36646 RepID=UPI002390129D|nr:uncharacterized protein N7500_001608 [Penicillium coprophilum]KAJ5173677.1 hypothetical protein N7500_001608 [Penicillium coprophilum]